MRAGMAAFRLGVGSYTVVKERDICTASFAMLISIGTPDHAVLIYKGLIYQHNCSSIKAVVTGHLGLHP